MTDEARYREAERRLWESVGVTPTEQRIRLDTTGVSIRVQEVGEGVPVLFLHGASNAGSSWAGLVSRLGDFRCLIVDKPGAGLSQPFEQRFDFDSVARFADDFVAAVLNALGLERAHVVATSYGGYTALRGAAAHPERIERIVELGWTTGAPIAKVPVLMRVAGVPAVGRMMTAMPAPESAVRAMFKRIGLRHALESGRISQEMIDWFRALLNHTDTMRNELEAGPQMISLKGMDERIYLPDTLLASIRTPVYFLWGTEDPFGGPEIARSFVAKIPTAELELLPGAGHAVWMDDPDKTAEATKTFLHR